MALVKLDQFYPDYRDTFEGRDIKNLSVYTSADEKVGTVDNALVDEHEGRIRYLIVDTGFWIFGKRVLLPIGMGRIDYGNERVYVSGLTKQQVEELPEFNDDLKIDEDYEEQVRGVYRPTASSASTAPAQGTTTTAQSAAPARDFSYDRNNYHYDQEPNLYGMNEQNHQSLKLYEERLIANKRRVKSGEVSVGKHVETQTAHVAVPVEKERVIVERNDPTTRSTVPSTEATFREGEVARVDVYEEAADIQKQAVVREEVNVRKEVTQETVEAQEQIRREELDVNAEGRPVIDRSNRTNR